MKKLSVIFIILSVLISTVGFSSCDSKKDERQVLSMDISTVVINLDPLISQSTDDFMIAENTFEGLLTLDSDNSLQNGVCENYTVSDDGLTYTFTLKNGLKWSNESAVTSDDFRFAVERALDKTIDSPYAGYFDSLIGAKDYHAGKKNADSLGIETPDENTIIFRLSSIDKNFLYTLAQPFSMPCNREFFENCGGKYGLSTDMTIFNGYYTVSSFDKSSIVLRANKQYYNQRIISASRISIAQGVSKVDAYNNFYQKNTNIVEFSAEDSSEVCEYGNSADTVSFYNKTYTLTFNFKSDIGGNMDFRRMISKSINLGEVLKQLPECYTAAEGLIPPDSLSESDNYRQEAGSILLTPDSRQATASATSFKNSFADGVSPKLSIIYPNTLDIKDLMTDLVTPWQVSFGLYVNPEPLSSEEFDLRISTGDYDMAIIPYAASDSRPLTLLNLFSDPDNNAAHYSSEEYNRLLSSASKSDGNQSVEALAKCEQRLVTEEIAVIPLFCSSTGYAMDKDAAKSIAVTASGGKILFKNQ